MNYSSHTPELMATGLALGLVIGVVIDYYKPKRVIAFLQRLGLFKNR